MLSIDKNSNSNRKSICGNVVLKTNPIVISHFNQNTAPWIKISYGHFGPVDHELTHWAFCIFSFCITVFSQKTDGVTLARMTLSYNVMPMLHLLHLCIFSAQWNTNVLQQRCGQNNCGVHRYIDLSLKLFRNANIWFFLAFFYSSHMNV